MPSAQPRHTLIRTGMHLRSRQLTDETQMRGLGLSIIKLDDAKTKTTLYRVRWKGYGRKYMIERMIRVSPLER